MKPSHVQSAVLTFVAALTATTVVAQEQGRPVIEEVVVTAQKRAENIRDVPISITALGEDALNEAGITDVGELSKAAPNMVINATPYTGFVAMRGLGSGNNKGFERSVALVIDGVYYGRQDYLFEALADVQRIEVLRGPQGTLFGKNAIAGALNVTTGKATPEFTGTISAMGGALDRKRYRAAVGGALIDNVVNARLIWDHDQHEGIIKNSTGMMDPANNPDPITADERNRDRNNSIGRLQLHFPNLIDGMDINLSATKTRVFGNSPGIQLSAATDATLEVYRRYDPATEADDSDETGSMNASEDTLRAGDSYTFQVDYELGEHVLTGIWGASQFDKDHVLDADFGPAEALLLTGDDEYSQQSLELRVASPPGLFEYVAGLYYYESDFVGIGEVVLYTDRVLEIVAADRGIPAGIAALLSVAPTPENRINNNRFFDQHTESAAVFGQATWNVSDQLALILGMRYSEEEKTADAKLSFNSAFSQQFFNTFLNESPYDEQLSRKETDFSPKVSMRYEWSDEVTFYATYARAFKAGGFNEQAVDDTNLEFEPEEAETYEAGVKTRFYGGAATLNVGLFYTSFDNLQISLYNGTNFEVGNAATAISQGVEIEGQLLPTQWLSLAGSIAYLDAHYDEFPDGQCPATSEMEACDLGGRELTRAPEWEVTFNPKVSLTRLVPWMGENLPFDAGVGMTFAYRAHQYFSTDLDPIDAQGGHTEVGAVIKLTSLDEDWTIMLSGRNITDKKVQAHGQDVPLQPGTHFATMEGYARYYAEFQYRW